MDLQNDLKKKLKNDEILLEKFTLVKPSLPLRKESKLVKISQFRPQTIKIALFT